MAAASAAAASADLDACRRQQGVDRVRGQARSADHVDCATTSSAMANFTETELQRQTGYSTAVSTDYVSPENRRAAQFAREDFRGLTIADVER